MFKLDRWLLLLLVLVLPARSGSGAAEGLQPVEFELQGEIRVDSGAALQEAGALVLLHGVATPFAVYTWTDSRGRFKFRNLRAGIYTVLVEIPGAGTKRETVDVSAAVADSRGRIERVISVPISDPAAREGAATVSVSDLAIPDQALDEYARAVKKLSKNQIQDAVAHLQKAVELAPHYAQAHNHLGTIAYQQQDYKKAEGHFRNALSSDPEAYAPVVNLAAAMYYQGDLAAALELNRKAVARRPEDPLANAQLGFTYVQLGEDDKAVAYLSRSKQLEPGHFSYPQLALAELYQKHGESEKALKELKEFVSLHPDAAEASWARKLIEVLKDRDS